MLTRSSSEARQRYQRHAGFLWSLAMILGTEWIKTSQEAVGTDCEVVEKVETEITARNKQNGRQRSEANRTGALEVERRLSSLAPVSMLLLSDYTSNVEL